MASANDQVSCEKRRPKCSGCHLLHENHDFGNPGPACQGPQLDVSLSVPKSKANEVKLNMEDEVPNPDSWEFGYGMESHDAHLAKGAKPKGHLVKWKEADPDEQHVVSDEVASLMSHLARLEMEEKELQQLSQVEELKQRLAEKENSIRKLRSKVLDRPQPRHQQQTSSELPSAAHGPNSTMNIKGLRQLEKAGKLTIPQTPLDNLLAGAESRSNENKYGSTVGPLPWREELNLHHEEPSIQQLYSERMPKESEMFLSPKNLRAGTSYLKIVDYIDRLVPQEDERTISQSGQYKFVLSYGQKKQKLEDVTLSQWVVGNTRIMYTLLFSNKLPTNSDIRDYFCYTVKVMELANKYEWKSVLHYDDEFRHLQAVYGFPWSYDSNHLHTVILEHKSPSKLHNNSTGRSGFGGGPRNNNSDGGIANLTRDGKIICRSFNSINRCSRQACKYIHCCNRKLQDGKACGQGHQKVLHNSQAGKGQGGE